jgi:acyl carrier protein
MKNISALKKTICIFKSYGIPLTGKRKSANFYKELNMDKIYVSGLVFELEYCLDKVLADEKANRVETPSELIGYLMSA